MITDMETWTNIRRDVLVDGMSMREACKKYHLNFRTIQKILSHAEPPGYCQTATRDKPTIGPFIPIIQEILEADKQVHKKQRHTGKRIFDRLRDEHGYTGGITVVRDEIRRWKRSSTEVFMPLSHPPGEAQFDFGERVTLARLSSSVVFPSGSATTTRRSRSPRLWPPWRGANERVLAIAIAPSLRAPLLFSQASQRKGPHRRSGQILA